MSKQRILVVEDDDAIRQGIVDALELEGYTTFEAACGNEGLRMAVEVEYDLLLLDLVLPHRDGLEILRAVREVQSTLPVVILSARGQESDRVDGLKLGADDYVVKPFSVAELLARVEAVLRRSPERPRDVVHIAIPGGRADFGRCEICFDDGQRYTLSDREMELLRYLVNNAGRAVSREEILRHVWRMDPAGVATRTIDMHIARLREKLRDDTESPGVVLTVRGKGYMFAGNKDGS